MYNNLGFSINTLDNIRKDAFLFGESPSRIVVSIEPKNKDAFEKFMLSTNSAFNHLGNVTSGDIIIDNESFGNSEEYKNIYDTSISEKMK